MRAERFIRAVTSVVLLISILYLVGIEKVIKTLFQANAVYIGVSWILGLLALSLNAVTIYVLIPSGNPTTFKETFEAATLSFAIGSILPSRIGELSFPYFVRDSLDQKDGFFIFFLDKVISLGIIYGIVMVGALYFYSKTTPYIIAINGLLAVTAILAGIIFVATRRLGWLDEYRWVYEYALTYAKENIHGIVANMSISLVKWGFIFVSFFTLFKAFSVNIRFGALVFIVSLVSLLSLIPVTLSGLGIRETSGTYFFNTLTDVSSVISLNVMLIDTLNKYSYALLFYAIWGQKIAGTLSSFREDR